MSATKAQSRENEKKFTCPSAMSPQSFPGPWLASVLRGLASAGRRVPQRVTGPPPQVGASQEWSPTSLWWVSDLLSSGLLEEGPGRLVVCVTAGGGCLDVRFNGGSHEEERGFCLGKVHCGTQHRLCAPLWPRHLSAGHTWWVLTVNSWSFLESH